MNKKIVYVIICVTSLGFYSYGQIIYNLAGFGNSGNGPDGISANSCPLDQPWAIAIDNSGNIYFSDFTMSCIRKVNTSGIISTVAGTCGFGGNGGDGGQATITQIGSVPCVAVDNSGNLYFSSYGLRKVNTSGVISTIAGVGTSTADGIPASQSQLNWLNSIAVDATGNIYVTDLCRVRKIDLSGNITTIVGTGTCGFSGDNGLAISAQISNISIIALDGIGNLYIGDEGNFCVRKVNSSGIITTVAGIPGSSGYSGDNGPANSAQLNGIKGLGADSFGNLYITDTHRTIRKVNPSGIISTYAGTIVVNGFNGNGITAYNAWVNYPQHITTDGTGNVYFCDRDNHRVRVICSTSCLAGVEELNIENRVRIFPNPATDQLQIDSELSFENGTEIEITNMLGQVVLKIPYTNEIDVSKLSNGYYILKIENKTHKSIYSKFMKEN